MLLYAKDNLNKEEKFGIVISDSDSKFQDIAAHVGFIATAQKENDAAFYIDKTSTAYHLPEGFYITTMKDTYDLYQYRRVLWKGFNHELNGEGEFTFSEQKEQESNKEMIRPNVDLSLKVAVVSPDGILFLTVECGMTKKVDLQ